MQKNKRCSNPGPRGRPKRTPPGGGLGPLFPPISDPFFLRFHPDFSRFSGSPRISQDLPGSPQDLPDSPQISPQNPRIPPRIPDLRFPQKLDLPYLIPDLIPIPDRNQIYSQISEGSPGRSSGQICPSLILTLRNFISVSPSQNYPVR